MQQDTDRIGITERAEGFSLREFVHDEAFSGILLLLCALTALIWANSPWGETYDALWETDLTLGTVQFHLTETLRHWVNDGLMAVFFFVVGLEIKRELLVGELASPRQAALPAVAALGGVLVPAGIYALLNRGTVGAQGWGIPMATDIAFALGVLALLGDRIPLGLKVFLTALAIVDDIAAVLVIAVFYTTQVTWAALGAAAVILVVLIAANRLGARRPVVYAVLGLALWLAVFESGVHATVAGVLLALTIPANTRIDPRAFLDRSRATLVAFDRAGSDEETGASILTNGERQEALAELEDVVEGAGAPLHRMEHVLHPWVAFAIMPLFALANAGVRIEGDLGAALGNRVTLGVVLGLVLGKQVGVTVAAWLAVRAGATDLPEGVAWRHIYGAGWLSDFTKVLDEGDAIWIRLMEACLKVGEQACGGAFERGSISPPAMATELAFDVAPDTLH
ncbi:MAG: Na+/H+ antiporter NhaA [Gemmatimonadota bacterium]|nr:Na+/H+ antiporter NhaA [Gemmatimonadota bacterium]